ncbi:Uncharacterised protein [Burkholderia gladioli]|nr:Uncharacterised protein [Burkholderia gladioli]
MQELQARLQLARRQIGVQRQVERGIGIAIGIDLGAHVEQRAEVGFAHEGEARDQARQRARLGRHAAQLREPDIARRAQPGQQRRVVLHHRVVLEHRQRQPGAPALRPGARPAALGARGGVVGMRAQPARIEAARVAIGPAHRERAAFVHPGLRWAQVLGRVDDLEYLLARHGIHAVGAGAVVAQPGMVERAEATVAPGHGQVAGFHSNGLQGADQGIDAVIGDRVHGERLPEAGGDRQTREARRT